MTNSHSRPASDIFWNWFNSEAAPLLSHREISFRKTFEYLDAQPDPIIIVETGCVRIPDNWAGDGQSTRLFDRYAQARGNGAHVYSVDLNPNATSACRALVSETVTIHTGDSVGYLHGFGNDLLSHTDSPHVSLFYLDSYDVDWRYPFPSAAHHLKELAAISPLLRPETLVVIDDSPIAGNLTMNSDQNYQLVSLIGMGGKGFLVAEYAAQVGAETMFSHYQVGFIGFRPKQSLDTPNS